MDVIDLILNLAALLLWLNWRSLRFDPLVRTSVSSLAGTLRRAEPRSVRGWQMLLSLALLLVFRAVLYWLLGAPVEWTPKLHLGAVVLAFRADAFAPTLLYSLLGFLRILIMFYFWMLVVTICNRGTAEADPVLKLLRLHLGRIVRWPWPLLLLLIPVGITALWFCLNPLLVWAGALPRAYSVGHLVGQSLLLSLALVLTLKFVLPFFLLLHFVASYVYLGSSPIWDFIATTSGTIMKPLRWLPLRYGKLDLRPLAAIAILFLLLDWVPHFAEAKLAGRGVAVWPQ